MPESIPGVPGVKLYRGLWATRAAAELFAQVQRETPWETHRLRLFGREVTAPRRSAWYGDRGASYTYSGLRLTPTPWTPTLARIRDTVQALSGYGFNSVLLNLYRDGRDCMGWHSDDEPELGPRAVIASVSLGAVRAFCLRHKRHPARRVRLLLPPASLLLMGPGVQEDWRHHVPRTRRPVGARINLTFRRVRASAQDTR